MKTPNDYIKAIGKSGLSIYDPIVIDHPELWIPTPNLEILLDEKLKGISLAGLPLRTRSKVVKEQVCRALGYPIPPTFKKTKPRFPGQFFDTYIQKSNNLQIWNEEVSPTRRYVVIRVDDRDVVTKVKVVTGQTLAALDTTGTLTQKYQARMIKGAATTELVADKDTDALSSFVRTAVDLNSGADPTAPPSSERFMSIGTVYERLRELVGMCFPDKGHDQERKRAAELHRLVCLQLGYTEYGDDGQFPDVRHQLLELKLQTSPTIDLGMIRPDGMETLGGLSVGDHRVRHCDVRYALFFAETDGETVTVTHFFLTTGEKFFSRFPQFQGKVVNRKLQIPLPSDFFRD